jgi:two-component system, cell cycle sensor histidine kinase and response regulator CckA
MAARSPSARSRKKSKTPWKACLNFEPFFTTKDDSKGTGLGLATVYGIVKQNQGFIHAATEVGIGTMFTLYLPPQTSEASPVGSTSSTALPKIDPKDLYKAPQPITTGETVLLVEDEDNVLSVLAELLGENGYRVLTAPNGKEALEILGRNPGKISVAVSDVNMPGMNGFDLAKQISARQPEAKVILISGNSEDQIGPQRHDPGIAAFIPKPFNSQQLVRVIKQLTEQKTAVPQQSVPSRK